MGPKFSAISRMLHPSDLIMYTWPNTWQRDKVEGLVVLGQAFWLVRRESPATDSFIMCHEDFPNKALYDTKRVVHIT